MKKYPPRHVLVTKNSCVSNKMNTKTKTSFPNIINIYK